MEGPTARQTALVDRLATPRWYHPVAGAALALLVGSFATQSAGVVTAALLLYVLSLYALPRAYRRSTGVWFTGTMPPRARRWARRLTAIAVGGLLVGAIAASFESVVVPLVAAVVAFGLVQVLGSRFDATLRAELLQDPEIAFKIEERDEAS